MSMCVCVCLASSISLLNSIFIYCVDILISFSCLFIHILVCFFEIVFIILPSNSLSGVSSKSFLLGVLTVGLVTFEETCIIFHATYVFALGFAHMELGHWLDFLFKSVLVFH